MFIIVLRLSDFLIYFEFLRPKVLGTLVFGKAQHNCNTKLGSKIQLTCREYPSASLSEVEIAVMGFDDGARSQGVCCKCLSDFAHVCSSVCLCMCLCMRV